MAHQDKWDSRRQVEKLRGLKRGRKRDSTTKSVLFLNGSIPVLLPHSLEKKEEKAKET